MNSEPARRRSERRQQQKIKKQQKASTKMELDFDSQEKSIIPPAPQMTQIEETKIDNNQMNNGNSNSELMMDINRSNNYSSNSQQQRSQSQLKKLNPTNFLRKIPNRAVMREFFISKCKYYCNFDFHYTHILGPPQKDLNIQFCKDILSGKKKLLKFQDVNWIENVPQWEEFTAKFVWESVKNEKNISKQSLVLVLKPCRYFQKYTKALPSRSYLLNIVNTINPQSVAQAVNKVKAQREAKNIESMPIVITNELANLLEDFESVSQDLRESGLSGLREYKQCMLCLANITTQSGIAKFKCKRHIAHKRCIIQYKRSVQGQNSQYFCPLRCNSIQN